MRFEVHEDAVADFMDLGDDFLEEFDDHLDSRKNREKGILKQRDTGISYDSHGEPVHYFKFSTSEEQFRVFFEPDGERVVLLGVRMRREDTYVDLRELSKMVD